MAITILYLYAGSITHFSFTHKKLSNTNCLQQSGSNGNLVLKKTTANIKMAIMHIKRSDSNSHEA